MNAYEVTYIINPALSDDDVKKTTDKYNEMVANLGGQVSATDVWGKRRLAYEINGNVEGTYVCMKFSSSIESMNECKRLMNLDENIVRSLFIRLEK